ncbi:unnamed protein product [Rotaria sp. Silwood1]|nr:unnamed protein product [Rotaria sp. Silwood1]CAF1632615.1 unnamed protein product [Rotaria sp. Silwood1]CAF3819668.1 unnamed protein product [Rotaria sp. Silwood1]CAF3825002.1 unnamed protein product [Rotaria sp. Silwood1]CAF3953384.1 unnamed protein product [Rotaria sp. Silwood1]
MTRTSLGTSRLPQDVLTYTDKQFYDFIKNFCGQDTSDLLSIQAIRSVDSFLSIQDVYSIFEVDSDDVKNIKKQCGFQKRNGIYTVRPVSIQSTVSASSCSPFTDSVSNINTNVTSFISKKVETEQRALIEKSIQEWCIKNEKIINISDFNLISDVDYYLQFSSSLDNLEIKCSCGILCTVFLGGSGNFKLSNYFRHLKTNCLFIQTKVKKNNQINNEIQDNSQDFSSIHSSQQTSTSAGRKRAGRTIENHATKKKIRKN